MNNILIPEYLIPIALIIIQSLLVLFLCIQGLKRAKVLSTPLAGIEYSQAIFAAAFLFGALLISYTLVDPALHSFHTYRSQSGNPLKPFIPKFGQFFIVCLFFLALYILTVWLLSRILLSGNKAGVEIETGNIPFSILLSGCVITLSVACRLMASEFMSFITPHFVNFR